MGKLREEFTDDLKWNVKDLFNTEDDYKKEYSELNNLLPKFKKYENHILDNSDTLYELLAFDNEFNKRLEQIYIYAHINNDQDTTNIKYQTMYGEAYMLYSKYNEITSYIVPEILKCDYIKIENFIKENSKLKEFERSLKELFKVKDHVLSDREEKLLSTINPVFKTSDDVYSLLTDADLKFPKIKNEFGKLVELNERSYRSFIESTNRKVRRDAFNNLFKTYSEYKNTYAKLLASEVTKNNKLSEIRKYSSALEASLYGNDIPTKIYTNLIKTVKENIKPLSNFWKLKKDALKVKELHLYDTYAPIIKEVNKKFSVKEAKQLLLKSLSVLGDTYISDLNKAFDEAWIDYAPNEGKRGGAYCTACYNVHPYVLLSYDGSLNNVSTLAHELGHAMHYYYAIKNQKFQDYGYSIFVAEVASQVNQILLSKYLINNTSDIEEKKYLIADLISDFKATIYRQTMFAEFELKLHEMDQDGIVLTHENMCDLYYKLNEEYFGKNIVIDDVIRYEWERIPHFYMGFYVYQYATAYAAAIKIAMDILNKKENAVENYLKFLGLGCTKTPIDSLKVAGVDMTDQNTLKEAFDYFNDLVSDLTKLYKK